MPGGLGGKLFLRGEARPLATDHARAALGGDLTRRVGGFGIHHENFIRPTDRLAGRADVLRFVESDDRGGGLQGAERQQGSVF